MSKEKPKLFPEWAKELVQDQVNKEFNRYEPPRAKKDVGWARGEVPPRQWVNYQYNLINEWIEYLYSALHKPTHYATKNDLPDPATSEGWLAYVDDEDILAVSNGTAWRKIRTGAL